MATTTTATAMTMGRRRRLVLGFHFFNFFFDFLFLHVGDISTSTRKSDFRVQLRRTHAQIAIFADELLQTG